MQYGTERLPRRALLYIGWEELKGDKPADSEGTPQPAMHVRGRGDGFVIFFFSSRRGHTRFDCDWSSDGALPIFEFAGTGISIGDRLLEDTTVHTATTTGRQQPWVEARTLGDEPLGSVFDPFPLDRNNVLATRDSSQLLALTSRHAFVRAPRTPAPRPRAGVAAAARIGDGLVVVISRHALGALGPQFRPTTAPVQQLDALERTGEFLHALARWTRRPAEWAHVPPAAHGVPLALAPAPVPVELAPPLMLPPRGLDTS